MKKFSQIYFLFPRILISICTILILSLLIPLNSKAAVDQNNFLSLPSQSIIASHQYDFARPLEMNSKLNNKGRGRLQISLQFPKEFPIISIQNKNSRTQKVQFAPNAEYQLSSKPNQASVPFYTINIIVPKDAKRFRISDIKAKEAQKTIDQPLTIEKNKSENRSSRKSKGQPSSPKIKILKTSQFRDVTFLRIQVFPIDYDSSTQVITQSQAMQFDLNFQTHSRDNSITIKDPENNIFHKIYQSKLLNYQWKEDDALIKGRSPSQQGEYHILSAADLQNSEYGDENAFWPDYLIVRSQAFISSSSFNAWLNYRISQQGGNHTIAVASLEDVYAAYSGTDNPQRIKDCIRFIYENWGQSTNTADLIYLMLLGDADFGSDTEPWFIPAWDSNNSITGITGDNKYGCLEGDDGIPELLIGRLPVKDETELSVVLEKTINFETTIPQGENHFGTRHLFLAGSDAASIYSTNGGRYALLDHYQESEEYNNLTNINPGPNFTFTNNDPHIQNLINERGALTISYNGDTGEETGWMPENIDLNTLTNIDKLASLVISASSRTARFDWPEGDSFGERWIKKDNGGSVAFFGPSRTTSGYSYFADEDILKSIYNDGVTILGAATLSAKLSYFFSYIEDYHRYNFLGDPAINIVHQMGLSSKPEVEVSLTPKMPQHPFAGDNISLNIAIKNIGLGTLPEYTFQGFNYQWSGDEVELGPIHVISNLESGQTYIVEEDWEFQEKFHENFRVDTNVGLVNANDWTDELSEFNNENSVNKYFSVQYPMHFDINNTTGIEIGSYEHPYTKLTYPSPHYSTKGMKKIIDGREPSKEVLIYFYPGIYGEEEADTFSLNDMSLIGDGEVESIIIEKDSFYCFNQMKFNNITFNSSDSVPIVTEAALSVKNCIFYGNDASIQVQNTWPLYTDGYSVDITNNIFFNNANALRIVNEEIEVNFTNNVVYDNTKFVDTSSGDDSSNSLIIKNNIIRENTYNYMNPGQINIQNDFNNTDIEYLLNTGSDNIDLISQFVNPTDKNFHLQGISPCVNAGDPDPIFYDLDNTVNDMGAYGGPSTYDDTPIKITSPADGNVLFFPQEDPITFDITWQTNGIDPDALLKVRIYTINSASPDSGGDKPFKKKSRKPSRDQKNQKKRNASNKEELQVACAPDMTIYLDETTLNTGIFTVQPDILERGFYFLRIYNVENPSVIDQISFEIENNRYRLKKTIEVNHID